MMVKILVVDDDWISANQYREIFEFAHPDWEVTTVTSNASDGLDASVSGAWDLIVWDIWMTPGDKIKQPPVENDNFGVTAGIEAIKMVRLSLKRACPPIIATTILGGEDDASRLVARRLSGMKIPCLIKPFETRDLIRACEMGLRKG